MLAIAAPRCLIVASTLLLFSRYCLAESAVFIPLRTVISLGFIFYVAHLASKQSESEPIQAVWLALLAEITESTLMFMQKTPNSEIFHFENSLTRNMEVSD